MKLFFRAFVLTLSLIVCGTGMLYAGIADDVVYVPDNTDLAFYMNYEEVFSYMKAGGISPDDYSLMFGDREGEQIDDVLKRFNLKISDIKEIFACISLAEIANQKFNFIIMLNAGGKGDIPAEFKTGAIQTEQGTVYTMPDSGSGTTPVEICYLKSDQYFIMGEKETLVSFLKKRALKNRSTRDFHKNFVTGCRGRIIYGNMVVSDIIKKALETAASAGAGANIDILQSNPFIKSLMAVKSSDFAVEMKDGFIYTVGMYGVTGEDADRLVMVSDFGIVSMSFLFTIAEVGFQKYTNQSISAVLGDKDSLKMIQQILGRAKVKKNSDSVIVTMNETKAESEKSLAVLKALLDKQKQARAERIESEKISVLTNAIINNDTAAADKALAGIKNINMKDSNGDYPLGIAAMYGNMKMLKAFVAKGAKVDLPSTNGNTALHLAVSAGMLDAAVFLVEKGADVNAKNDEGMSPLYINASQGETKITQLLLRKGAQVNAVAGDGYAPIHRAAEAGNLEVIKVLVQFKADVELASGYQERAIDIASRNGFEDIVTYFKTTFKQVPVERTYDNENYDEYNSDGGTETEGN